MISRENALVIVEKYTKSQNLKNHMLAVESAMIFYAKRLGEPADVWGVTGLLHDFDWEIHPTKEEHPSAGALILRENNVPEEIIEAILSHGDDPDHPRITSLAHGLYACDEITGLITAVALVRPSRSLYDLESSSVKKKWKDKAFAAGANREEIARGADELDIPLWDHVENVIIAMRGIAPILNLEGNIKTGT